MAPNPGLSALEPDIMMLAASRIARFACVLLVVAALSACSKSTAQPGCGGAAPTASVTSSPASPGIGTAVQMTGSATSTCDGETFTYAWSMRALPQGSTAALNNTTSINPTFKPDVAGAYTTELVVTASNGVRSAPVDTTITASACGSANPSVDSLTATPAAPNSGSAVTVAAAVSDADNAPSCGLGQTFNYAWQLTTRPPASTAFISDPAAPSAVFHADVVGSYQVALQITDSTGRKSSARYLDIATTACGTHAPTVSAQANPTSVQPTQTVALLATPADADNTVASSCNLGETFTYSWKVISRPQGSSAVVSDPAAAAPVFVPDAAGAYQLGVTVTDSTGLSSAMAFVNVTASACNLVAPSAGTIASTGGVVGSSITVSTTPSDLNCLAQPNVYTYQWELTAKPGGSQSFLSDPAAASPSLFPDVAGTYQVSVIVKDSLGIASTPSFKSISAMPCGGSPLSWATPAFSTAVVDPQGPLAAGVQPVFPAIAHTGAQVQLTANFTDTNSCGIFPLAPFTYRWALVSAPAGSRATLSSTSEVKPTFIPDVPGTYQVAMMVTDALGNSTPASPSSFATIITSTCGKGAPIVTACPTSNGSCIAGPPSPFPVNTFGTLGYGVATVSNTDALSCPPRFIPAAAALAFSWQALPANPSARFNLSNGATASTLFQGLTPGDYTLRLIGTAPNGVASAPYDSQISVVSCGSAAPVIVSTTSSPAYAPPNTLVTLGATATDADILPGNVGCSADGGAATPETLSYSWSVVSLPSGSSATLAGPATAAPTFTPDVAGSYVFSVVASDGTGLSSSPVQVTVTTGACGPTLAAFSPNPNRGALMGTAFLISPTAVTDTCIPSPKFSYLWSITSRPTGSQATLVPTNTMTASPATGLTPDLVGDYQLTVVAIDNAGNRSAPASVTVSAATCTSAATIPVIAGVLAAPATFYNGIANPNVGDQITFSVPSVSDPATATCGTLSPSPYRYQWQVVSAPAGSRAQLSSNAAPAPSLVPDLQGSYTVSAMVIDNLGQTSAAVTRTITTTQCGAYAPVAQLCSDGGGGTCVTGPQTIALNSVQRISVSASDADNDLAACPARFNQGNNFTYDWRLISTPPGTAALATTSGTQNSIDAFSPGTWVVQATPAAPNGVRGGAAQFTFQNVNGCGGRAPTVTQLSSSPAFAVPAGPVTLNLTALDSDIGGCGLGQTLTYQWAIVSFPAGSAAALSGASGPIPNNALTPTAVFTPDVPGPYVFAVKITDSTGLTSGANQLTVNTVRGAESLSKTNVSANGTDFVQVTTQLSASDGSPAAGITVTYSIAAAGGAGDTFSPAAAGVTDGAGRFVARFSALSAGPKIIHAVASLAGTNYPVGPNDLQATFGPGWTASNAAGTVAVSANRIRIDPNNSNNIYSTTSAGAWFSTNGGNAWTQQVGPVASGLGGLAVARRPGGVFVYVGNARGNGACPTPILGRFDGTSWFANSGGPCWIQAIAVDPADASGQTILLGSDLGGPGVNYSTNGGSTLLTPTTSGLVSCDSNMTAAAITENGGYLVGTSPGNVGCTGTNGGRIYRNTLAGLPAGAWTRSLDISNASVGISAMTVDPLTQLVLVGTTDGRIFRSSDEGLSFGLVGSPGASSVNDFSFDANRNVFAATGAGVFRSTDYGNTWTPASGGLPAVGIGSVAFEYTTSQIGYASPLGAGFFKTFSDGF